MEINICTFCIKIHYYLVVFQPDCRLVAVTLSQGGINDKKKHKFYQVMRFASKHTPKQTYLPKTV